MWLPFRSCTSSLTKRQMKKKFKTHLTYNCHWIASLKQSIDKNCKRPWWDLLITLPWGWPYKDAWWRNFACVLLMNILPSWPSHSLNNILAFCRASKLLSGVCGDLLQAGKLCQRTGTLLLDISCRNNRALVSSLHSSVEMPLPLWVFH